MWPVGFIFQNRNYCYLEKFLNLWWEWVYRTSDLSAWIMSGLFCFLSTHDYRCNFHLPFSIYDFCRADSVAWNPHKMLLAGIQCCALLVKDNSVSPPDFFFLYSNSLSFLNTKVEIIRKQLKVSFTILQYKG